MKRIILLCLMVVTILNASAQNNKHLTTDEARVVVQQMTDTMSVEQKTAFFSLAEDVLMLSVDSIVKEGMYLNALEMLDSVQVNWKYLTGMEPSSRMYLKKQQILSALECWQDLINTTKEHLSIHKEDITDGVAAITYSMQGCGFRNIENYQAAIRSYEYSKSRYDKLDDMGGQGDMMCSMALCYHLMKKHTMASTFYEKGLALYLKYFKTTRSALLKGPFVVNDNFKSLHLDLFACHLVNMAIHEQDIGDRIASQEYLKMAVNCGSTFAKSEYLRIYGY